jgi:uncharacterized protein YdhG (YjbR/CyaY superfamily)
MQYNADNPEQYVDQLPNDRKEAIGKLRKSILENLPEGFIETVSYGMIGYVVPHTLYPKGYHCDPKLPLPFMNIASQKNHIALYHMGIYGNKELLDWFVREYITSFKSKPDMGKGCFRFKKPDLIPYQLIGELTAKISVTDWIKIYEQNRITKPLV